MTLDFSSKPYHDDYDKRKGFHKILFKPSVSVQARELNQMQEILQQQIERLGTHLFKNGTQVVGGQSKLNAKASYVILENTDAIPELHKTLLNKELYQDVDGTQLQATVIHAEPLGNHILAVLKYTNSATKTVSGEVKNVTTFSSDLVLTVAGDNAPNVAVATKGPNDEPSTGPAILLTVEEGVYYVDGYFVHNETQSVLVGWNDISKLHVRSGFHVEKDIKTAYDDPSLFDNATGSPNEAAVGADRFSIILNLITKQIESDESDFIEIIRYEQGSLRVMNRHTQYNQLADTLARRTYDESGDYSVHGLDIRVIDHLKDSRNVSGFKTKEEGGDDNLMAIEITDGKAYVKGYEVENLSSLYLEVSKARTKDAIKVANNVIQPNQNGEYVYLAPGNQFVDFSQHPILWLTNGQESNSTVIGYAIPKYIESISISGQTIFKLYGSFHLSQSVTHGWQHIGGWKLSDLKNGPVLQKVILNNVTSTFQVNDGSPLTSHVGYTPYAYDGANKALYVKKAQTAPVFNTSVQVVGGSANGFASTVKFKESAPYGAGDLIPLSIANIKTTKDSQGNFELTTDVGYNVMIQTNSAGYGIFDHLGNGVFTGSPVAAHTTVDNAYFGNIVNIERDGKRLVINNTSYPNAKFAVSAMLNKQLVVKTKTLAEGYTLFTKPSARQMVLQHKDVYKIKHVYVSADLDTEPTDQDQDVGQYFQLINNDTLDFYQNTMIKAVGGFATPQGQMKVVYEYFLHGAGDVFTVDSYESLKDNPVDAEDVTHIGRIPSFVTSEKTYVLSDHLDFRQTPRDGFFILKGQVREGSPEIALEHDYSAVIAKNSLIHANGFTEAKVLSVDSNKITADENASHTGTVHVVINVENATNAAYPFQSQKASWSAVSGQPIVYDASYFVERWDKVVYYKNGEIRYVYGVPDVKRYPETPVDAMSLATLIVPPYTKSAAFVKYKKEDNRRYTMRDIGKLEQRIENLEYYTSLTLKELETKEMKITDTNGMDRFKSGFFVSDFNDFGVFSPFDGGFQATLVPETSSVIPMEYTDAIELKLNKGSSSNYQIKGSKVFLPYTDVVEIQQPYGTSTETINPYLIIKWNPNMTLTPPRDTWVEEKWAPTVTNITNLSNQIVNETTTTTDRTDVVERVNTVSRFWGWRAIPPNQTREVARNTAIRSIDIQQNVETSRTTSQTVTNRLLGTSVIPYMRSRIVRFVVKGMKPDTRYYASFDAVDVNRFCRPVNTRTNSLGSWGQALISDAMGNLVGDFNIPPAQFSTGSKTFSLSDVNVLIAPDVGTECEAYATYMAHGTLKTMQEVIDITNRTTTTINRTIVHNRVTTVVNERTVFRDRRLDFPNLDFGGGNNGDDPLAQSFTTKDVKGAGMFVTKVDLFFSKKDNRLPVFIELREMVNGYPVTDRIAGSLVAMPPERVKTSSDSTAATTFVFDEPIWLESGKEFCIVVHGATSRYHVWISKLGEKVVNENKVVGQQPTLGSLFKSQNATTWTPYQLEDLKFRLYRAKFNTNVSGDWNFENTGTATTRRVQLSDFSTTQGSRFVKVKHPNHGMEANGVVKIRPEQAANVEGQSAPENITFNGVSMKSIYGEHIVKDVISIDEYTIEVSSQATKTGKFEDVGRYVYIDSDVNYYAYRLNIDEFIPPDGDVRYHANLVTGKDFDGGQTPKAAIAEHQVKNNDNNFLQDVALVQSEQNETTKTMTFRAAVKTANDYVSPVIALEDNSVVVSSLALNKPESDGEDNAKNGKVSSKILTKVIRLKTPADSLRILTSENKLAIDDIEVYYRTTLNRDIEERGWIKIDPVASQVSYDLDTFIEHERKTDELPEFDEFQLKIVFKGTNSVRRPALKDLRAIAVA